MCEIVSLTDDTYTTIYPTSEFESSHCHIAMCEVTMCKFNIKYLNFINSEVYNIICNSHTVDFENCRIDHIDTELTDHFYVNITNSTFNLMNDNNNNSMEFVIKKSQGYVDKYIYSIYSSESEIYLLATSVINYISADCLSAIYNIEDLITPIQNNQISYYTVYSENQIDFHEEQTADDLYIGVIKYLHENGSSVTSSDYMWIPLSSIE